MKSQSELQLAFFNDTINHYNSNNRGERASGTCSYMAGCAIGRHLDKKLCKVLDAIPHSSVSNAKVFNMLPKELQALGQEFLAAIQSLHDVSSCWDEKGLTEEGLEQANNIKYRFNLNHKKNTHKKITHNQAQDIINVACYDWKVELANLWGRSIVLKEIISITDDFYKKMRAACNKEQHVLFDEIFGVDKPVIDYDRLKTGSVVKIQYTAKYCPGGVSNNVIKNFEAATIIFYKEKHGISTNGEFLDVDSLGEDLYITFQQGKQFLLFKFDDELACIVDVIKY